MGTRGLTNITLDGTLKVSQYGQWDHYPEGQGLDALESLRTIVANGDLPRFKELVRKIQLSKKLPAEVDAWIKEHESSPGFISMANDRQFAALWPQFQRDLGAGIISLILSRDGEITSLRDSSDFEADTSYCEGVIRVDLDQDTLQFDTLYPDTGRLWDLHDLPSEGEFLQDFANEY